jgi:deoxyribodipyrimidine photo-lyase
MKSSGMTVEYTRIARHGSDSPHARPRSARRRPRPRERLRPLLDDHGPAANFALERAAAWAERLEKPLLILEALRCDYPWACDRFHRFILDGMRDNARAFEGDRVRYYPYVEPERGAGKGLLAALAARAAVVVTDDFPAFMIPRMRPMPQTLSQIHLGLTIFKQQKSGLDRPLKIYL